MRNFTKRIHYDAQAYLKAMLWEFKLIIRDKAVLFSFIGVAVLVSFLYTYIYSNEVLSNLPVAIIDMDNTTNSRKLTRMIDVSQQVKIKDYYADLSSAKRAFEQDNVRGIIVIPNNFSRRLQRGEQPTLSVYADASYMLYYKQIVTAAKTAVGYMNAGIQLKKKSAEGKLPQQAKSTALPVRAKVISLYNPLSGYATFLIPIVLVIIFQTSMLTSIGILGGTMREQEKMHRLYPHSNHLLGTLPIVMGKATTYLLISILILLFMTVFLMPFFNIPMRTSFISLLTYMIPFLLSVVYLGIFLNTFFARREDAILFIMFTSIPALLVTGFSWPTTAMPEWVQVISYFFPSTLGAKGFVELTQMGADFSFIKSHWLMLWGLCIFYLILAVLASKQTYLKEKMKSASKHQ